MLTGKTLKRINDRPRKVNRLPLLAVGGGAAVLSALLYALEVLPAFAVLAVLLGGVLLALLLYRTQRAKTTISLSYEGRLKDEVSARFSRVSEALEGLASSEKVWRLTDTKTQPPNTGEVAPPPEREPARVGLLETPGIRADVPIRGIGTGRESLFFFPEGLLLYKNDRYEPVSYKTLEVAYASGRFLEEEDLPEDAKVVDHAWRYTRADGSPDRRIKDNARLPVVLYGLLELSTPSGLRMRLQVSDRLAASRFARAFGAKVPTREEAGREGERPGAASAAASGRSSSGGRERAYLSAEDLEREAQLASARKTLGVARGASAQEIGSAYRKLARAHHPDKVANLEHEAREHSERRMKEINAAYSLLKRQWNDPPTGEARAT